MSTVFSTQWLFAASIRVAVALLLVAGPAIVTSQWSPKAHAQETTCKDRDGDGECDTTPAD